MRYTKIASLTAAAFLTMAASVAGAAEGNHDIRIVLPEQPGNLEPCGTIITTVGQVLSQNVTESLATVNPKTGQPEPKLATKWEQLNPTTWRLSLRKGVKFQDGADFNAKAVAFSIDRMTGGKLTCNNMAKFGNAKLTVTPVDEYTVDITSDKPQPILPTLLSVVMMVSPNTPADKAVNDPVGTGPFKLASFTQQNIVLEPFSGYWGDKPAVTKATYVWRQESSIRAAMIETGEADLTPAIAIQDANNPDTDFAYLNSETTSIRIDAEQPPLDDVRIRKALNLAIDWDGLSQLFGEDAQRASQMVVEGIVGHDSNLKPWPYDPKQAKALIAEAKKDGVKVDTEIRLIGRNGIYPNGAEAMEAMMMMWREAGLNIKLVMLDVADWLRYLQKPYPEDRGPTLLQSMHDNNKGDAAFTIPIFYRSTGQYSVLNSPEMDAEIDAAMAATGTKREQAFQKIFDEALTKYVTDIPMYHMIGYTRVGKRLEWKPDISTNSEIPLAGIRFKK